MKNSKNKVIASLVCGIIMGSIGTSFITTIQVNSQGNNLANLDKSQFGNGKVLPEGMTEEQLKEMMKNKENMGGFPGGKGGHHKGSGDLEVSEGIDISKGSYSDGTYEGEADAYAPNLKVQVKIANGLISSIDIVSHNETPGFYETAFELVPQAIIENQSTEVDTVSGATYTSVGIMNAVNDALEESTSNLDTTEQ